jgi:uncharacterized NAD-dependent epimerase/dehydratase family protein
MEGHIAAARLTNPDVVCIGIAVNTSGLTSDEERHRCLSDIAELTGLPAVDPVIDGVAVLVANLD